MVEEMDKKMQQATVHNLTEQRLLALARCEQSIEEMRTTLELLPSDSPNRELVETLLKTLHKTKVRLAGGLIHRSSRRG